jgi:hypothetical protein
LNPADLNFWFKARHGVIFFKGEIKCAAIFAIVIDLIKRFINCALNYAFLPKLPRDNSLRDFLMVMA